MTTMTRQHFQLVAEITGETIATLNLSALGAHRAIGVARRNLGGTNGRFDGSKFSEAVVAYAEKLGWLGQPTSGS